jgi:replicative DNA helicase
MVGRPCFRVEFDDGSAVVADAQHQWLTEPVGVGLFATIGGSDDAGASDPSGGQVRTTAELATALCRTAGDRTAAGVGIVVGNAAPLELPTTRLPLPPYLLGQRLAAGDSSASMSFTAAGTPLVTADNTPDSRIPTSYLRASPIQRHALLAGIVDVAGTVTSTGAIRVRCRNGRLADGVRELAVSLGCWCSRPAAGSPTGDSGDSTVSLVMRTTRNPFRLSAERAVFTARAGAADSGGRPARKIIAVRPVASVPVRCVQVDNAAHLYLAGRAMIPTHNSTLGLDIARAASIKNQLTSVLFSLEMSKHEITMRLLSAEARIPLQVMRTGQMRDDDWVKLTRRLGEMASAPLFIDDSPNLTMMEIRAKARRLKQRNDLRLLIVDYLQLMTSHTRVENRQQEVSQISRSLKLLAKELEIPVIALSQLNRGPEQRTDKKPQLADLRESGAIEQDADVVILLHREDVYERESPRAGEADLIVAKHRNGPTSTLVVAFQGHYSRFVDMAAG